MRIAKLAALLALAAAQWASAQTASTSLTGTVTDAKGAVIVGANLTLSNPATGFTRDAQTNAQGVYQFLQVPPATYELRVGAAGFGAQKRSNTELMVNTPATLDFTLQIATTQETVEVTSSAPLVNTQEASLGHAFNSDQISYLPFEGREATSILSLQPGVAFTGNGSNISAASDSRSGAVNGARSDQTNVTLDGVDDNDQTQGLAFTGALRATLDSLQEFRVTTSNATADAGRSSGGQVSLVTKSGTNTIHGSAYWYYRPPFGAANDWFNENAEISQGLPNSPPFLLRNTFGATFGGPIRKNRLFYFLAYEGQRTRENLQVTRVVPSNGLRAGSISYPCTQDPTCPSTGYFTLSPADLATMDPNCTSLGTCPLGPGANPAVMQIFQQYPQSNSSAVGDGYDFKGFTFSSPLPAKLDTYVAKFDYNITPNSAHQVFVRGGLMSDRGASRSDSTSITGTGGSEFPGQPANVTQLNNSKGLIAGYTGVLRTNLINNLRYGYIHQGFASLGTQSQHFIDFRGLDNLTAQTPSNNTIVPVHNVVDDVAWTRGAHTIEFGGNLRIINNIRDSNATSFFTAQADSLWLSGSCISTCQNPVSLDPAGFGFPAVDSNFGQNYDYAVTALAGLVTVVNSNYNLNKSLQPLSEGVPVPRHFRNHEYEFYAQDTYHLKPNLTVTYGLRYTLLQPPYETNGTQVAPDQSLDGWFKQRAAAMLQGQAYEPLLSFSLSGQAIGKKPYRNWNYNNFAPRLAIAYAPKAEDGWSKRIWGGPGKSSIRAGYGIYYDHFGEGVVNSFDQLGSFGLTTSISNAPGVQTVDGSARFSAINTI
ncbi:MAG TPA: carboxypeptidase-like regulatory domain-containing protein, partial [Candidatus Binatia bacterium]|nr:carboxypeptidase-like regulatory domain-containing protein [Candidatus Binatia bacterium]